MLGGIVAAVAATASISGSVCACELTEALEAVSTVIPRTGPSWEPLVVPLVSLPFLILSERDAFVVVDMQEASLSETTEGVRRSECLVFLEPFECSVVADN